MKKKSFYFIIATLFAIALYVNVSVSQNSKGESEVLLKNLEALACYSVEVDGSFVWNCCSPWEPLCMSYVVYMYGTINY